MNVGIKPLFLGACFSDDDSPKQDETFDLQREEEESAGEQAAAPAEAQAEPYAGGEMSYEQFYGTAAAEQTPRSQRWHKRARCITTLMEVLTGLCVLSNGYSQSVTDPNNSRDRLYAEEEGEDGYHFSDVGDEEDLYYEDGCAPCFPLACALLLS